MTKQGTMLRRNLYRLFKPPDKIRVWQWADKNRVLSGAASAEPGKWKSKKTPYMIPIMDAFTEPVTEKIYVLSSAQTGKSELLNNIFGYIVDIDPGPIMWIHPTVKAAKDYSKERISTMISATLCLVKKIAPAKSRSKGNNILNKAFVGGNLSLAGSNAPADLRSKPIRYFLGDEVDAWARSTGGEGDPGKLGEARTITFFNRKIVWVSTPTLKGMSAIDDAYHTGTQEEWQYPCPNCEEFHFIDIANIIYDAHEDSINDKSVFVVENVKWQCPVCGFSFTEREIKSQKGEFVSQNPSVSGKGIRSFRLSGWISPWLTWEKIIAEYLECRDDPRKLQVVYNTLFGKVFENRGDLQDEDTLLTRREEYEAVVPEGALILTCGVDVQGNRLEYEIVGHGKDEETWGIEKKVIHGRPEESETWEKLDIVLEREYPFRDGNHLRIFITFVDSGYKSEYVMEACRQRRFNRVFAIKGKSGNIDRPYLPPPKMVPVSKDVAVKAWLYTIYVDIGKERIMSNLGVDMVGARYCHFPLNRQKGYDEGYFNSLLSEIPVLKGNRWVWEVIPGHERNEALDCRNYALAALEACKPLDMDALERKVKLGENAPPPAQQQKPRKPRATKGVEAYDEW